jgi:hypothetical protein
MALATAGCVPQPEGHLLDAILPTLDQLDICFDDTHAVANAGLLLAATLAERLAAGMRSDGGGDR